MEYSVFQKMEDIHMYYDFLVVQVCRTYFFTGISESLSLQFMYIFTSTLTTSLSTYTMKQRALKYLQVHVQTPSKTQTEIVSF